MCTALEHGGPDDEGMYENEECKLVLGHRRLSIIDISTGGHQPMYYAAGRYVISYNGELYNYREIKDELIQKGASFRTHSDTEVIVHLYEELGSKCVHKLRGMFSFALFDLRCRRLLLARDRLGKKPLYYAVYQDRILFASEIKAILAVAPELAVILPAYNEIIVKIAHAEKVVLVDHWSYWRKERPEIASMQEWLNDPIHPNARGHREFARLLFRTLDIYDDKSPTCQPVDTSAHPK